VVFSRPGRLPNNVTVEPAGIPVAQVGSKKERIEDPASSGNL